MATNLKNPHFLTANGCAEYYPIWKTPLYVGGKLADLINGSLVNGSKAIQAKKTYYEKGQQETKGSYYNNVTTSYSNAILYDLVTNKIKQYYVNILQAPLTAMMVNAKHLATQ